MIPVTVDDLAANGLLGDEYPQTCWERSVETLMARKEEITGLAIASDERLEAYLLFKGWGDPVPPDARRGRWSPSEATALAAARGGQRAFRIPKVHPAEISKEILESLRFRPAAEHLLYAARAASG